jgi:hypothetical protein
MIGLLSRPIIERKNNQLKGVPNVISSECDKPGSPIGFLRLINDKVRGILGMRPILMLRR